MKKVTLEWEQKYYEEKAKSIKIPLVDTMRVAEGTSSTKPMLASMWRPLLAARAKKWSKVARDHNMDLKSQDHPALRQCKA